MTIAMRVETYQGLKIMFEAEGWYRGSFYAANGSDYAADCAESIEDARAQIDDYWAEQSGRGGPCEYLGEPS